MNRLEKIVIYSLIVLCFIWILGYALSFREKPERIKYGVSFNTLYARELGLDPRETYLAILDDLEVKHLRLAAHWTLVEKNKDVFDFSEIDYQVSEAEQRNADVILAVGRRLPRWPECHVPEWAKELSWEDQKKEIRELITKTVNRYKDHKNILYWQVENEPFLEVFAKEECGPLDEVFLKEEIELVKRLDPTREVVVTDSGNLGLWYNAYKAGDVFGTSAYVYLWNPEIGPFKSILPAAFYRLKYNLLGYIYGIKPGLLIELSAEPWLLQPIIDTPLLTQLERMNSEKFEDIIRFGEATRFERQYLWGAEWWYWLKMQGLDDFWKRAERLFFEYN